MLRDDIQTVNDLICRCDPSQAQLDAWVRIKNSKSELAQLSHNTGSPKLLDEMERFAIACERAGNGKDSRCVRSWVKQLRAGA
jgi:hypothetical protein